MAEVRLFHHAVGLTAGTDTFAEALRAAGHSVHTPELFKGRRFSTIAEGLAYVQDVGFEEVVERGIRATHALPDDRLRGVFARGGSRTKAGSNTKGSSWGPVFLLVRTDRHVRHSLAGWCRSTG